ncbi:MAG: lactonase family protein [Anaerolineales bacterium]|nr:lactonase family protein [Anaerolineales bacterium]
MSVASKNQVLFVGTYTEHEGSQSKGIYVYRMDPSSGELKFEWEVKGVLNPSFLDLHPQKDFLYAVNEVGSFAGEEGGGVSAFAVDPGSGELTLLNAHSSRGQDPCYISIEQTGRFALVANYSSGRVAMLPIQPDGGLGPASDEVQHSGSSVDPERQTDPHAHCIRPDPTNRFAIATDLGADKLLVYQMDLEHGKLNKHTEVRVQPGAGPRHFSFHPNGRYMYLLNELNATLIVFRYHPDSGNLEEIQTITTLPEGYQGRNLSADLHIHGKYLYASNRGHDSLVCFFIDENTGKLIYRSHTSTGGKEPRNFAIDPGGTFLLAANQNTDNIVVFGIDAESGQLFRTGHQVEVSMPVCLKFAVRDRNRGKK